MKNIFADRVNKVPPYIFVQISRKIAEKKAQGINVISFGIGDPDLPTPSSIIDQLISSSKTPENHRYPESEGLPNFRKEVSIWYKSRFGIEINAENEIISLIGAKEGIGHAAFCFIDPGDIALVPDPGYPVYSIGTLFAGGQSHLMPLTESNGWLPDIDAIPADIANKAKVIWLNYPNNPTGAIATLDYFKHVVKFAEKFNIAVLHDACYTEVTYDNYQPPSFLETPGAMDIGAEFHSLSKTFNMTPEITLPDVKLFFISSQGFASICLIPKANRLSSEDTSKIRTFIVSPFCTISLGCRICLTQDISDT